MHVAHNLLSRISLVLLLVPGLPGGSGAEDIKHTSDIAVVVNSSNPLSEVTLATLRKLVLGEQTKWSNHQSVLLVLRQPGIPEQDAILRSVAHMDATQFRQYWSAKVFRGEAPTEPLSVPSSGLASEYVATHAGAVAFIRGTDVRRDLKVLKVDGILPGEANYPIQ